MSISSLLDVPTKMAINRKVLVQTRFFLIPVNTSGFARAYYRSFCWVGRTSGSDGNRLKAFFLRFSSVALQGGRIRGFLCRGLPQETPDVAHPIVEK